MFNITFLLKINRVHVCPTDDSRMVTCGRDNVRFWRVRSNQLRSCPAVLPSEPKIEEVTDIKFAPTGLSEREFSTVFVFFVIMSIDHLNTTPNSLNVECFVLLCAKI